MSCKGFPDMCPNVVEVPPNGRHFGGIECGCGGNESTEGKEGEDDEVNHPSHYTSHPSGVECITITEHMTFCAGNAVKYLWRAGLKDCDDSQAKKIQDLRKAAWYATREADRLERE